MFYFEISAGMSAGPEIMNSFYMFLNNDSQIFSVALSFSKWLALTFEMAHPVALSAPDNCAALPS